MYKKFKININHFEYQKIASYYSYGKKVYNEVKVKFNERLDNFRMAGNRDILDGSKLQEYYFPILEDYDIFLSHSHDDIYEAKALAGFFYKEMDIRAFIDSSLWFYAGELLQKIDEKYCLNEIFFARFVMVFIVLHNLSLLCLAKL